MTARSIKHRSPRSWHKISITLDARLTEAVSGFLAELTSTGFEISIPDPGLAATGSAPQTEVLTTYIEIDQTAPDQGGVNLKMEQLREFLAKLNAFFPDCPNAAIHTETIPEEDWTRNWKRFFSSFRITDTLTIKPSWEAGAEPGISPENGTAVIVMDPGLAFGTGHHASTQLALQLLEEQFRHIKPGTASVLDVGTGSGILAMGTLLYGAGKALAIDNDPDAVETAQQNILINKLEKSITVSSEEIASLKGKFDVIVANITHDILTALAGDLTRLTRQKGVLVLSGILQGEQERSIRNTYEALCLECIKTQVKDEWAGLLFQKK